MQLSPECEPWPSVRPGSLGREGSAWPPAGLSRSPQLPTFLPRSSVSMALTVWWRFLFTPSREPLSCIGCKAECSFFPFFSSLQETGQQAGERLLVSELRFLQPLKRGIVGSLGRTLLLCHLSFGSWAGVSPQAAWPPFLPLPYPCFSKLLETI